MTEEFIKTKTWKDNLLCLASSQYFQKKVTGTIGKELIKENQVIIVFQDHSQFTQQLHKEIDALEAIYNEVHGENEKLNIKYPLYKVEMKPGLEKNEEFFEISRQQLKTANIQLIKISKSLNKTLINQTLQQEDKELLFNGANKETNIEDGIEIKKFLDQQIVKQRRTSGISTTLSINTSTQQIEKVIQQPIINQEEEKSNREANMATIPNQQNEQQQQNGKEQQNQTKKKKNKRKRKNKNKNKLNINNQIENKEQNAELKIQENTVEITKQECQKIQEPNIENQLNLIQKQLVQTQEQNNETLAQQLAKQFVFQSIGNIQQNMISLGLIHYHKYNQMQNEQINRQNAEKFDNSLVKGWELLQNRWNEQIAKALQELNQVKKF